MIKYRYPLANDNRRHVLFTKEQISAINDRDYLLASKLGVMFDVYMSCIDPDYPKLVA